MSTGQMTEEERKLRQQKAMQDPEIQLILQVRSEARLHTGIRHHLGLESPLVWGSIERA